MSSMEQRCSIPSDEAKGGGSQNITEFMLAEFKGTPCQDHQCFFLTNTIKIFCYKTLLQFFSQIFFLHKYFFFKVNYASIFFEFRKTDFITDLDFFKIHCLPFFFITFSLYRVDWIDCLNLVYLKGEKINWGPPTFSKCKIPWKLVQNFFKC